MGYCRFWTKWLKRKAFAVGDGIVDESAKNTAKKYIGKAEKKMEKKGALPAGATSREEELEAFRETLLAKLNREKGLGHCKVREYWLRRAPRLFCVTLIILGINLLMREYLKADPDADRVFVIIMSIVLLIGSLYMLYRRLPDAVEAGMLRVGHDYYARWKQYEVEEESKGGVAVAVTARDIELGNVGKGTGTNLTEDGTSISPSSLAQERLAALEDGHEETPSHWM